MTGHALAIIGAQNGSEGKGAIVSKIALDYPIHVRTGGPNAGHTIYHQGQKFVMQVIPCGWINPHAKLVIGAGMLLDVDQFMKELEEIKTVDPNIEGRILIDWGAGILDRKFHDAEGGVNGELHQRIGSTGEGVGAARIARLNRNPDEFQRLTDLPTDHPLYKFGCSVPRFLKLCLDDGIDVLLEGTQGSGLSLIHGPWPYVTTADCNAAQLAADAGIAPSYVQTLLVARTMPIRVAGNSGPLMNETTWEQLSEQTGRELIERTTVTKKVRRIGYWDHWLFERAVILNNPIGVALTFADYLDSEAVEPFITKLEQQHNTKVLMVGRGGKPEDIEMRGTIQDALR